MKISVFGKTVWAVPLAAALMGGLGVAAGFVIGRWPLEGLEERLGLRVDPRYAGWSELAETDLPRYEMLKVQVDSVLYIFGGFYSPDTRASERFEALNLRTGAWTRLSDMPIPLTHANPVVVRDELWIAGGFEGDHPGPATDRVWRYSMPSDRWEEGPPLPARRGSGVLLARGDTLHYIGGYLPDRDTNSSDHWVLTLGEKAWREAPPLPLPRGHASAGVVDGKIYFVGGSIFHDPFSFDVTQVDVYDPTTRTWSKGASSPVSTSHTEPATTVYGDRMIFVGGRDLSRARDTQGDILNFDPGMGVWVHGGAAPKNQLAGIVAVYRDSLIVGLGAEVGNNPTNPKLWKRAFRDHWRSAESLPATLGEVAAGVIDGVIYVVGEGSNLTLGYDMASGRWIDPRSLAARPWRGHHHAAEVFDGELILLGGLGAQALSAGRIVQIFNPTDNEWRLGPPMPFQAGSSASALIGDRIYLAGGIVGDTTTSQAAVLDLTTMTWSPIADMPRPRNHAASGTDGSRLYVFGGRGPGSGDANVVANGYDDVQIYDPATDSWAVSDGSAGSPPPLPQARGGMGKAVYLNGEFWVMGGETLDGPGATEDGTYARVDIFDPETRSWRRGPDLGVARHGIFPLAAAGHVFVAGGGTRSGFSGSRVMEIIWPQ